MRGGRRLTSTLYLRFMRSTTISTWRLPTPETRSCFVSARLRLDRERDRRLRERDLRQLERVRLLAERIARLRLLQLLGDADLASAERLDVLLRLALEPRDVPHPLPGAAPRVQERRVRPECAAGHAEERELADVRVAERL